MEGHSLSCAGPLLKGSLTSWSEVKHLVVEVVTSTKDGILELNRHRESALELIYDVRSEAECPLGHYALRLAFYVLVEASERAGHLCSEPSPFAFGGVVEVLSTGWPVFGLLALLGYRLVRDGAARGVGRGPGSSDCSVELENFRVRYAPAAFEGQDVRFSRDVEEYVLHCLTADSCAVPNATQRCLLGAALPLLGHAASLQCIARRDAGVRGQIIRILNTAEIHLLRPAASASALRWRRGSGRMGAAARAESRAPKEAELQHFGLLGVLAAGFWAAEAFMLLQLVAPAFAVDGPQPPLGGPEPPTRGGEAIVSFDPHEDRFHGRGLPAFAMHAFAEGRAPGFRVRPALPCADVLIVRDSLPTGPFPGALVYVDHEAGIGPGRDAGRLDVVLAQRRVVYLGVLEPLAETRCLSRWGAAAAWPRRTCAKVYSGRAPWPPGGTVSIDRGSSAPERSLLTVLHVPLASTSFAGRQEHSPGDLATESRPFVAKEKLLAYLAYTCVDHRERMFDLLASLARQGLGSVEALSRCAGYQSGRHRVRNHTRSNGDFLDEAVQLLRPYRFALVFENKLVPGYVTEKIVNAFLAGCIPVYWGSTSVLDIFNPDAFVYANALQAAGANDYASVDPLAGLDHVAFEVLRLATDPAALHRMATAPVLSQAQLVMYFSWHPAVQVGTPPSSSVSERLSSAVQEALRPRRRLGLCEGSGRVCAAPY